MKNKEIKSLVPIITPTKNVRWEDTELSTEVWDGELREGTFEMIDPMDVIPLLNENSFAWCCKEGYITWYENDEFILQIDTRHMFSSHNLVSIKSK